MDLSHPPFPHVISMLRIAPILLATLFTAACSEGGNDFPPPTRSARIAPGAPASARLRPAGDAPSVVAHRFLTAIEAEDEAGVKACLTEKARELVGQDGGFSFQAARSESFTLGREEIDEADAGSARVAATVTTDGTEQAFELLLRAEDDAWRVHGMDVPFGEASWTISFEGAEDTVQELFEGVAAEMSQGITEAFEDAMDEWAAGGSTEDIAEDHARFDALASEDAEGASWRSSYEVSGSAEIVLRDALRGTGYELDPGEHAEALGGRVQLEETDVSRAQLIEAVAEAVGLVPVYEDERAAWTDEAPTLTFRAGPRETPVAFAGPFVVELFLEEEAPQSKGTATLRARGLGLPPSWIAANAEMSEFLRIREIHDGEGTSLFADEGMQFWSSPTVFESSVVVSVTLDLIGLLRSVETLQLEADLLWSRAQDVGEARFDEAGSATAGPWTVTCKSMGETSEFAVEGPKDLDSLSVRFAPMRDDGSALGVLSQSSWSFGATANATLQCPETPASIQVKAFRALRDPVPFTFEAVPLARHEEQPEELVELRFEGTAPMRARFVGFADRSEPDFQKIELTLESTANKPVLSAQASFLYLDAAGELLNEFPHGLSPEPSFDEESLLLAPGETASQTVTAFFLPEGTTAVRVRIDEVTFEDGTRWKAD